MSKIMFSCLVTNVNGVHHRPYYQNESIFFVKDKNLFADKKRKNYIIVSVFFISRVYDDINRISVLSLSL